MSELYHVRQLPLFVLSKVCSKCRIEQPREEFSLNRCARDGLTAWCKNCRKLSQRVYNRTHYIPHPRYKYNENDVIPPMLASRLCHAQRGGQMRAKEQAVETDEVNYRTVLERDGFWCYICEQNIDYTIKKGPASLSFDHVIPLSRGGSHTSENISPVHLVCNFRKGSRLLEEMRPFQRWGYDF